MDVIQMESSGEEGAGGMALAEVQACLSDSSAKSQGARLLHERSGSDPIVAQGSSLRPHCYPNRFYDPRC